MKTLFDDFLIQQGAAHRPNDEYRWATYICPSFILPNHRIDEMASWTMNTCTVPSVTVPLDSKCGDVYTYEYYTFRQTMLQKAAAMSSKRRGVTKKHGYSWAMIAKSTAESRVWQQG